MRKSMHQSRRGCWRIISIGRRVTFSAKERVSARTVKAAASREACVLAHTNLVLYPRPCHDERGGWLPCFVIYGCITESGARMVNAWEMPRAGTEVCIKWRSTFLRCHAGLNPLPRSISSLSLAYFITPSFNAQLAPPPLVPFSHVRIVITEKLSRSLTTVVRSDSCFWFWHCLWGLFLDY